MAVINLSVYLFFSFIIKSLCVSVCVKLPSYIFLQNADGFSGIPYLCSFKIYTFICKFLGHRYKTYRQSLISLSYSMKQRPRQRPGNQTNSIMRWRGSWSCLLKTNLLTHSYLLYLYLFQNFLLFSLNFICSSSFFLMS